MSSEDTPVEETAPEVQTEEHMESKEECVTKEIAADMTDNNIGCEELDYEANDGNETNDASAANVCNGDNDELEKRENTENLNNSDICEQKKQEDEVDQEAVEEAPSGKQEEQGTSSIMKEGEQDEELRENTAEDCSEGKAHPIQQIESEESEVINCKEFDVTVLVAGKDDNVVTDKGDDNSVAGKGDESTNEKEATKTEEKKASGIETDPSVVCKPCNLVFESDKWCSRHKESGDHLHVVKGGVPGRGRYHCFLCWMSFQHSEGLVHHIGRSDHLKRAKRKGVKSVWMKPGASGAPGISTGDLRAQITGRGDLRDHLTDREDRKRREAYGAMHRDRDRRHHHRSRSPVRIYLDQFYEVSSVGDCDMGNCKSLRKIVSSKPREKVNKEIASKDNKTDVKDGSVEGGNEEKKEANQDSEKKKYNGDMEKKVGNGDVADMETDDKEQNHEMAEEKDADNDESAEVEEIEQNRVLNKSEEKDNDAQSDKEAEVNHQSETDDRFETNEESNKIEIITEVATIETELAVPEDIEMETDDKKDNLINNNMDQSDGQVNNESDLQESETSEKTDTVENCEDITEQLEL